MKNINGINVDYDRNWQLISDGLNQLEEFQVPVDVPVSPFDRIVKVVYRPDDRTGLPTSDLTYYVSDDVNPEIKEFILRNLQPDVSSAASPSIPEGISDEVVFALQRQENETVQDYRERLNKFAVDNVDQAKLIFETIRKTKDVPGSSTAALDAK